MQLKGKWEALDLEYLITAKILYFALNLQVYAFYLYRSIFVTQYLGVSLEDYGTMASAMACVSFPFMTIWGTVSDILGRPKAVLIILSLATAGSFELLLVKQEPGSVRQFAYVLGVLIAYAAFVAGLQPLLDVTALKILTSNPAFSKELYGRQRLWGTLAYALVTLLSAFLMDAIGQQTLFLIVPIFALVFAITLFLATPPDNPNSIVDAIREKRAAKKEAAAKKDASNQPAVSVEGAASDPDGCPERKRHPVAVLFSNPSYLFFLLAVFMTGLARATMTNFLAYFWKNSMDLSNRQIAIGSIFGIILEVVIFFFGPFFSHALGNYWMLLLAQGAMAARSWLYYFMPDSASWYPAVLAVELLKGVAFGFTHLAGIKTAEAAAPPGLQATSQAVYNSVYAQLPAVIAAFVGARLYKNLGPHPLFIIVAAISSASMLAFFFKYVADGSISLGGSLFKRRTSQAVVHSVDEHSYPSQCQETTARH